MLGINTKKPSWNSASDIVGLEFQGEGIAMVVNHGNGSAYECIFHPVEPDDESRASALSELVKKLRLNASSAVVSMQASEYSLMQLSSPVMSQAELKASLRWRIKELIAFPSEEAVVDVFEFPESGQRSTERLLYVAVARAPNVQKNVDIVRKSGLSLRAIDIGELAFRNILSIVPDNDSGAVALLLSRQSGLLVFVKNNELYMARRLDVGLNGYQSSNEAQKSQISEQVFLEIQRSLDYFEGHFAEPLPGKLFVFPGAHLIQQLVGQLQNSLSMSVEAIQLQDVLKEFNSLDEQIQSHCVLAAGAALKDLSGVAA